MGDQLNHSFQRNKGFGAPVDGNEGKESMFDLVPFAGGGRIVGYRDGEMFFVGQSLQGFLPQLVSHPIASSPIGGDQEFVRLGIEAFATVFPPSPCKCDYLMGSWPLRGLSTRL